MLLIPLHIQHKCQDIAADPGKYERVSGELSLDDQPELDAMIVKIGSEESCE